MEPIGPEIGYTPIFLALPAERGVKHPFELTTIYVLPMRQKRPSESQKHHRRTFHLPRYDPERWEQERDASLTESLREARERATVAEREAETSEKLLKQSQQEVGLMFVRERER